MCCCTLYELIKWGLRLPYFGSCSVGLQAAVGRCACCCVYHKQRLCSLVVLARWVRGSQWYVSAAGVCGVVQQQVVPELWALAIIGISTCLCVSLTGTRGHVGTGSVTLAWSEVMATDRAESPGVAPVVCTYLGASMFASCSQLADVLWCGRSVCLESSRSICLMVVGGPAAVSLTSMVPESALPFPNA
jgi:hypothetical protein